MGPTTGDSVHLTPPDHTACWTGTVLGRQGGDEEAMIVEGVLVAQSKDPAAAAPEPSQMYVALDAVTTEDDTRWTWHPRAACPFGR